MKVSKDRIRVVAHDPPGSGRYVLYWMIGTRRTVANHALDRAVEWCEELGLPLIVLEPLSCRFPWSTIRFHHFVIGGMSDNQRSCERAGVRYVPFASPTAVADRGLLTAFLREAAVCVTDEALTANLPRLVGAAARQAGVRLEAVDSMGLVPFRSPGRAFKTAASFRRYLQAHLLDSIASPPSTDALRRAARFGRADPPADCERWLDVPLPDLSALRRFPIDTSIGIDPRPGGRKAGMRRLTSFLETGVSRYGARGDLLDDTHSHLSPYLHFGHIGPYDVIDALASVIGWSPPLFPPPVTGARHGWWELSRATESFLDEVVTWRELSINGAAFIQAYKEFESLPPWALNTLMAHAADPRPWTYDLEILETGETHDSLWNAAQRQLVCEGRIHSYLRMLWGKKILEWTKSPRVALEHMIYLNDAYATDGRDPNTYAGIFWILGRYDRPWATRPVFGQVRYMSSESTARKFQVHAYVERYLG